VRKDTRLSPLFCTACKQRKAGRGLETRLATCSHASVNHFSIPVTKTCPSSSWVCVCYPIIVAGYFGEFLTGSDGKPPVYISSTTSSTCTDGSFPCKKTPGMFVSTSLIIHVSRQNKLLPVMAASRYGSILLWQHLVIAGYECWVFILCKGNDYQINHQRIAFGIFID